MVLEGGNSMANGATPELNGKWAKLLREFGLPTVLLGIFVWFVLFRMMAAFDRMNAEMDEQTKALQRIETRLQNQKP